MVQERYSSPQAQRSAGVSVVASSTVTRRRSQSATTSERTALVQSYYEDAKRLESESTNSILSHMSLSEQQTPGSLKTDICMFGEGGDFCGCTVRTYNYKTSNSHFMQQAMGR